MIQIRRTLATLLAGIFATVVTAGGDAPRAAGRLLVSPDASVTWVLSSDGRLFKGVGTTAGPWPEGAELPSLADIDLAATAGVLVALAPSSDGKLTELIALDASTGGQLGRWKIRGRGRLLQVSPDASLACVIGTKPRAAKPPRQTDWTLTVVDLAAAPQDQKTEAGERVSLGFEPSAAWFVDGGPGREEARLLLATRDRIASFTLDPPRSSWFYLSPGDNRAMAAMHDGAVLFLLRDGELAVINPEARPRDRERGQLADDDATTTLPVSKPATALGLASDGRAVAILHGSTGQISLIDTFTGGVIDGLDPVAGVDLIPRRFPHQQGEPLSLPMASSGAGGSAVSIATRSVTISDLPDLVPEPEPPAAQPGPAAKPAIKPELPVAEPLPSPPPPKVSAPEPEPEPVSARPVLQSVQPAPLPEPTPPTPVPEEPAVEPEPTPPAPTPEEPTAEPEPTPPAPVPEEPTAEPEPTPPAPTPEEQPVDSEEPDVAGPALEGRVTGVGDLPVEVLAYGPDNILELHGRARVSPDGTWRMPLPPPGGYRLVVTGGEKTHLFTSPQFMRVVVPEDPATLAGLDFVIRGNL